MQNISKGRGETQHMPLIQDHITQKNCCSRQWWTCKDGFEAFLHPHYHYLSQEKLLRDLSNYIFRILIISNSWFTTLLLLHTRVWLALAEGDFSLLSTPHHHCLWSSSTVPQLGAAPHICPNSSALLTGLQGRRALRATTDFGHHWFLNPQLNGPKTQFLQHRTFH